MGSGWFLWVKIHLKEHCLRRVFLFLAPNEIKSYVSNAGESKT